MHYFRFVDKRVFNFDLFFCFLTNKLYFRKSLVWGSTSILGTIFPVLGDVKKSCGKGLSLIFKSLDYKGLFYAVFWQLFSMDRRVTVGYFVELELIGLGFRVKKITNLLYRFFWGHANYLYFFVPKGVLVQHSFMFRKLFVFGVNHSLVNDLSSFFLLLKKLNAYRITGMLRPGKMIRLNSGKQR